MICPKCGAENPEGNAFCAVCGSPLAQSEPNVFTTPDSQTYRQQPEQPIPPVQPQPIQQQEEFDYTPISPWGYVGYSLLFAIPLAGIILMFVFAFGGTQNINLRNYARGTLISLAIGIVLAIIISIIVAAVGVGVSRYYY